MKIDPERLSSLRRRSGLSRAELARRAKLSERQIQRLETDPKASKTCRERTLLNLAKELDLEPGVLTGELPIPIGEMAPRSGEMERVSISAKIAPSSHLAFAFIKRRYNVNATTLINMAPLFFTLLAEGSLKWRREKLEEIDEATKKLEMMSKQAGHLAFTHAVWRVTDAAGAEEASINKTDIFGEKVSEIAFECGFKPSMNNPFVDYLRKFSNELGKPGIVKIDGDDEGVIDYGMWWNFPDYVICGAELAKITGGSATAESALQSGRVRLSDIPIELLTDETTDDRIKWLEERAPSLDELFEVSSGEDI